MEFHQQLVSQHELHHAVLALRGNASLGKNVVSEAKREPDIFDLLEAGNAFVMQDG